MKKPFLFCLICVITIPLFLSLLCGCSSSSRRSSQQKLSRSQLESIIESYLSEKYDSQGTISYMEKRRISETQNEEDWFVTISLSTNNAFNLWISDYGEIRDTGFSLVMRDSVNDDLTAFFSSCWPGCSAYDNFRFCEPSQAEWSADEYLSMLEEENLIHDIYLAVPSDCRTDQDSTRLHSLSKELQPTFNGTIFLYYTNPADTPDFSKLASSQADLYIIF